MICVRTTIMFCRIDIIILCGRNNKDFGRNLAVELVFDEPFRFVAHRLGVQDEETRND